MDTRLNRSGDVVAVVVVLCVVVVCVPLMLAVGGTVVVVRDVLVIEAVGEQVSANTECGAPDYRPGEGEKEKQFGTGLQHSMNMYL